MITGKYGSLITRLDDELKGSVRVALNSFNNQVCTSFRYSKNQLNQKEGGIDLKLTGFGKCLGLRYETPGLYVMNLMQKVTENLSVGSECVIAPTKKIKTYSFGLLCTPTAKTIATCVYSQLGKAFSASIKYSPITDMAFGLNFNTSYDQKHKQRVVNGMISMEKASEDSVFKTAIDSFGTISTTVSTTLRHIASNFNISLQANPLFGMYTWGLSLQVFR